MTVRELIKHLRLCALDAEVRMYSDEEGNRVNGIFKIDFAQIPGRPQVVVLIPKEE